MKLTETKFYKILPLQWAKLKQKPDAVMAKTILADIKITFRAGCNCGALKAGHQIRVFTGQDTDDKGEVIGTERQLSTAKKTAENWYQSQLK